MVQWQARTTPSAKRVAAGLSGKGNFLVTDTQINKNSRNERQRLVTNWCETIFGAESARDPGKRVLRFLEEALELFQAEGGDMEKASALLERVYSRPAGNPRQEVGGVSVTLLSYCSAAGLSADQCELEEINRVLDRPATEARRRYDAKTEAGF